MRGAILRSQGVSFVLQVRRLPNEERAFRPDIAFLPPCPTPLLGPSGPTPSFFKDFTSTGPWLFVKEKHEREKREQVISLPRVFGEIASSAVF